MDKQTFFKTPEGNTYGVSERVMALGHVPAEGVTLASEEDLKTSTNTEITISQSAVEELNLPENMSKLLISKIAEQEEVKQNMAATKKQIREDKLAAIEAQKQAEKEAAVEAEKEARKQAAIEKRQEILRIKMVEKQAAEEAARIEILVAERVAKIEAEKEAAKQAAIEAERLAALEASKPRKFSAA